MISILKELLKSKLFRDLDESAVTQMLEQASIYETTYRKGEVIIQKGTPCNRIGIISEGIGSLYNYSVHGESYRTSISKKGDILGMSLIYSETKKAPLTLVAEVKCNIIHIDFEIMEKWIDCVPEMRKNYIRVLSEMNMYYIIAIQVFHHNDVRFRIYFYLVHLCKYSGTHPFRLEHKKTEIADMLGIARPSLYRELKKMEGEGILAIHKVTVTIKKPEALKIIESM